MLHFNMMEENKGQATGVMNARMSRTQTAKKRNRVWVPVRQ